MGEADGRDELIEGIEIQDLGDLRRTDGCGDISEELLDREVMLMGWVARRRDLGSLIFVDLRDRSGIVQVVFDIEGDPEIYGRAKQLRPEFVVAVGGTVAARADGMANPDMPTGMVEVRAGSLAILNVSQPPPILVNKEEDESDELRMRYRYIDLRRKRMLANLVLRDKVSFAIRQRLRDEGFMEVETPTLTKATPEGARDFLVPSRLHDGRFYALPQSPQLFKQLLMVGGIDRYYQVVKCFRDEDFRADRQPEFTQLDMEMSFVTPEDVMGTVEALLDELFRLVDVAADPPLMRLTYKQAMERYGSDRPDLRNPLQLVEVSEQVATSEFRLFRETVEGGGAVVALPVPGGAELSRSKLDKFTAQARELGAGGLIWIKIAADGTFASPVLKFIGEAGAKDLADTCGSGEGDLMLLVADRRPVAQRVLGDLRMTVAEERGLIDTEGFAFLWVTEFPLFDYDEDEQRHVAVHHPFTAPMPEDLPLLETDPLAVRSMAYDIVVNGLEIGGGSIRIHRPDVQQRVFDLLGIGREEAEQKFGFLLDALKYGAPPHGGIALGLDRLVMVLAGESSIREVIPFPKTTSGICPLTGAPAGANRGQLEELGLAREDAGSTE
jgi:aspartyl-tRNA synthetase